MTEPTSDALLEVPLDALMARARRTREEAWGRQITYSPKAFLPVTNLCRNRCDYCTFRASPGWPGAHTMTPDEVRGSLTAARDAGCVEALLCLGDTPEAVFPSYRETLASWGFDSTVSYLVWISELALSMGMLPHTNAGILTSDEMRRLRQCNASLGLMLENISPRLCNKGMPHHRAPDKRPDRRVAMHREAGALNIPFTSGILIGIGETPAERLASLRAIAEIHAEYGHIQEVIVQNFRAKPDIPMAGAAEPGPDEVAQAVAWARLVMPPSVSVQAPPNLNPASIGTLIAAGANDLGGISPVTPDFINPGHPWPHLDALADEVAASGFELTARLPVYDGFASPRWIDAGVWPWVSSARARVKSA